jgi:hydrogenase maturation protease
MTSAEKRCLILACGNTLRSDDGVGPWLCDWVANHFSSDPRVHTISRQQWTPDLTEDIASADSVLFIDCSIESAPGHVAIREVQPASPNPSLATHHAGAPELLALAQELYGCTPRTSLLLTIGAGSTELGESFSPALTAVLPEACKKIEKTVLQFLSEAISANSQLTSRHRRSLPAESEEASQSGFPSKAPTEEASRRRED